jgi:hypothetical protein
VARCSGDYRFDIADCCEGGRRAWMSRLIYCVDIVFLCPRFGAARAGGVRALDDRLLVIRPPG